MTTEFAATDQSCPYPGLRPFEKEEAQLFFGRESHVAAILQRMRDERFVAVTGPSGCGKSSLIRAGVIPALEHGFLNNDDAEWKIAIMRPGGAPIHSLAESLVESGVFTADSASPPATQAPQSSRQETVGLSEVEELETSLQAGPNRLGDLLALNTFARERQLLILVDQFEELFTHDISATSTDLETDSTSSAMDPLSDDTDPQDNSRRTREEAQAFVRMLLYTARRTGNRVYILITMRTDFLGNCTLYNGLPEQISTSQYLTPRLSRQQTHEAIVKPARMLGCEVELGVVNEILNEMGNDPDQLPLMQHLLMRMWLIADGSQEGNQAEHTTTAASEQTPGHEDKKRLHTAVIQNERERLEFARKAELLGRRASGHDVPRRRVTKLSRSHYKEAGQLSNSIAAQADQIYQKLSPSRQAVVEHVFRQLTKIGDAGQLVRRTPVRVFQELLSTLPDSIEDQREGTLRHVLQLFSQPGVNFLQPRMRDDEIAESQRIDLAHESVVRNWTLAGHWARDERERQSFIEDRRKDAKTWLAKGQRWKDLGLTDAEFDRCVDIQKQNSRSFDELTTRFIKRNKDKKTAENWGRYIILGSVALIVVLIVGIIQQGEKKGTLARALQARLQESVHDKIIRASESLQEHGFDPNKYDIASRLGDVTSAYKNLIEHRQETSEQGAERRTDFLFQTLLNLTEQQFPGIESVELSQGDERRLHWSEGNTHWVIARNSETGNAVVYKSTNAGPDGLNFKYTFVEEVSP
ncbi:MAG: ATP-binding protein, partial [Planctomycetaceae bacterium]